MKIIDRLNDYVENKEFKITIFKNKLNIINYDEVLDFNSKEITIRNNDKIIIIKGNNLVTAKMVKDEILIEGDILFLKL